MLLSASLSLLAANLSLLRATRSLLSATRAKPLHRTSEMVTPTTVNPMACDCPMSLLLRIWLPFPGTKIR
jgi:hypothetical protein